MDQDVQDGESLPATPTSMHPPPALPPSLALAAAIPSRSTEAGAAAGVAVAAALLGGRKKVVSKKGASPSSASGVSKPPAPDPPVTRARARAPSASSGLTDKAATESTDPSRTTTTNPTESTDPSRTTTTNPTEEEQTMSISSDSEGSKCSMHVDSPSDKENESNVEQTNKRKKSAVWKLFTVVTVPSKKTKGEVEKRARCSACHTSFAYREGGTTSTLSRHMKSCNAYNIQQMKKRKQQQGSLNFPAAEAGART